MKNVLVPALCLLLPWFLAAQVRPEAPHSLTEDDGLSSNNVRCCIQDSRGFLWIGTDAGLDRYDGHSVKPFSRPTHCLAETDGKVWAGTDKGLWTWSHSDGQFSPFTAVTAYGVNIVSRVNDIAVTDGPVIWVGTEGQGLFLYNSATGALVQHSIHTPFVEKIEPQQGGRFLVTDRDGSLHQYTADGDYLRPLHTVSSPRRDTLTDREGTRWIPTDGNGLVKISEFNTGKAVHTFPAGTASNGPIPITESSGGMIIAGSGSNLYSLSPDDGVLKPMGVISPHGNITKLMQDGDNLWIGTDTDCICLYNLRKRRLSHYHTGGITNVLCKTSRGDIMAGTDIGLFSYNPREDRVSRDLNRKDIRILIDGKQPEGSSPKEFGVVSQSSVVAMCEDYSCHYLYLATSNRGLFRKDLVTDGWEHLVSTGIGDSALPWNKITVLFRSDDGTIWAGTDSEGLWQIKKDAIVFTRFSPVDPRLGASRITGITQDGGGLLWICSSSGLWTLDPVTATANQTGLKAESFLYASDGKLYLGERDGIISIRPQTIESIPHNAFTVIEEISVGDSTIHIPPGGRNISLSYLQNSFSIELADLSFTSPEGNVYSWQLSGIDRSWTTPGKLSTATYKNVPPGEYVFRVHDSEDSLHITIRPPWWQSVLAKVAYAVLGVLLVTFLLLWWQRHLNRRYAAIMKKQEEEREKSLYKQRIRFFIGLVHEIRTPLTLIRLQHDKDAPGADDTITRNLDYMQDTINRILTYDKNVSGDIEMIKTRMDLREVVDSVTESFAEGAAAEGIIMKKEMSSAQVMVNADEDMLTKILTNLLSNAMKYTRDLINVQVMAEDGDAVVTVSDNGPGVREDQREKIFGMFYTAPGDKIAEASGIGVGLAYARQLTEANGGTLNVRNASGGGATFELRIPLWLENAINSGVPSTLVPTAAERLTVLVAEDNGELRETLETELSAWYNILTAPDGGKAMELIEENAVDVVVTDVMMPVINGFELCRRIKGQLSYSHIPVILLTAKVSLDAKSEGMESGADAYVEKPFSMRQLRGQIDNLISLREAFRRKITEGSSTDSIPAGPEADFIRSINESIRKQLSEENFSIEALAYDMAMSRTNFFRKFKALTGVTPNDYLKDYRLDRAAELIREGARINEAAESVGFTSSSYFAKCFKARFGVLPKDYSKK